jgi:Transposase DDE domain
MSRLPQLYTWIGLLTTAFPQLTAPQVRTLAWFSFGMVLTRSASVTAVARQVANLLGQKTDTVTQRLREWYCEASAKTGSHRRELAVQPCFASLLVWVLKHWPIRQVALALDATTLGQRFTTLAISVVYKGCAVPVAWKILPATGKHAWKTEWLTLVRTLGRDFPPGWTVIVLTDRGLYAKWLFQAIVQQGWHPLMRVNTAGTFRPQGQTRQTMADLVPTVGSSYQGRGEAFQTAASRLSCTLLARWDAGYADPWLVLTDLPPEAAEVSWYGLRAWIEQGFKRLKSGGWEWQKTHMTDPGRAERLWLVMAVATWWCLSVGGEAETTVPVATFDAMPTEWLDAEARQQAGSSPRPSSRARPEGSRPGEGRPVGRSVSVFVLGRLVIVNTLLRDGWLRLEGKPVPDPWPTEPPQARSQASPATKPVMATPNLPQ